LGWPGYRDLAGFCERDLGNRDENFPSPDNRDGTFYTKLRWPTTVTAKYNSPRQNKIGHGKIQFITVKYNSKQQIQITHGKRRTLTAKTKTIIAIQNSSRQEHNSHGKSKTLTAIAKQSRQKQNAHGKIKSRIVVSGCPSRWCRV